MPIFFALPVAFKATREGENMEKSNKEPDGQDLLELLVKLLGEQEGVKIECVYERKKEDG